MITTKEFDECRVPIKSWIPFESIEDSAIQQLKDCASLPFMFKHVAAMPDVHFGYGVTIGSVLACIDVIIPNAIGSDIGCGVGAVKTNIVAEKLKTKTIEKILHQIKRAIPVGFNRHKEFQKWDGWNDAPMDIPVIARELESAKKQLGTMGSNNHFIELQKDDDDFVWIMIHSGSRHLGSEIADEFHKLAVSSCHEWHSKIPNDELAFLPTYDADGQRYIKAMNFALDFAQANRDLMMERVKECIIEVRGHCEFNEPINIHHNFAALENHFGKNVWVHRKGATQARSGQLGIIPGSMGASSYIVMGKGNRESFMSCSHGAGRKMGRKQASRRLTKKNCDEAMQGIIFDGWKREKRGKDKLLDLGEAPGAYKDIDEVINAQLDLITPVVKLQPLGVVKG